MLVLELGCGPGRGLYVGDDVRVRVLSVRGEKVVVGIEAPRDVKLLREELVPPGVKPSEAVPGRACCPAPK